MISVGDYVTHGDCYHVRGASIGVVEAVNWIGELTINWAEDGDCQRHPAHRSYSASDLKKLDKSSSKIPVD